MEIFLAEYEGHKDGNANDSFDFDHKIDSLPLETVAADLSDEFMVNDDTFFLFPNFIPKPSNITIELANRSVEHAITSQDATIGYDIKEDDIANQSFSIISISRYH